MKGILYFYFVVLVFIGCDVSRVSGDKVKEVAYRKSNKSLAFSSNKQKDVLKAAQSFTELLTKVLPQKDLSNEYKNKRVSRLMVFAYDFVYNNKSFREFDNELVKEGVPKGDRDTLRVYADKWRKEYKEYKEASNCIPMYWYLEHCVDTKDEIILELFENNKRLYDLHDQLKSVDWFSYQVYAKELREVIDMLSSTRALFVKKQLKKDKAKLKSITDFLKRKELIEAEIIELQNKNIRLKEMYDHIG